MLRALLCIASLAFAGTAAAQYKWVDKDGRVQYGDTPPPGVKVSPMRRSAPPVSQPEASDKKDDAKKGPLTTAEKDADFRKRQQEAGQDREKQAKARQEADDKRENCTRAQQNLRALETGRVARTDAQGERSYLDDAQLQRETAKARQDAQQWCS
jgi:uncharacterized protein DUF4124